MNVKLTLVQLYLAQGYCYQSLDQLLLSQPSYRLKSYDFSYTLFILYEYISLEYRG